MLAERRFGKRERRRAVGAHRGLADDLTVESAHDTLGNVIKERDDLELVRDNLAEITSGG